MVCTEPAAAGDPVDAGCCPVRGRRREHDDCLGAVGVTECGNRLFGIAVCGGKRDDSMQAIGESMVDGGICAEHESHLVSDDRADVVYQSIGDDIVYRIRDDRGDQGETGMGERADDRDGSDDATEHISDCDFSDGDLPMESETVSGG